MSNSSTDPDLTKRRILATVLSVIALLAVLAFTWWIDGKGGPDEQTAAESTSLSSPSMSSPSVSSPSVSAPSKSSSRSRSASSSKKTSSKTADIPDHVAATLEEIDSGRWPESANAPGTRGGDTFRNREGNLPKTTAGGKRISYKEWDVNPRERGRSRDAERIVTGSDGSAWYTSDHYRNFTQIRGPSA